MRLSLDLNNPESYKLFLAVKSLPRYRFVGREAVIPDEYADRIGVVQAGPTATLEYQPIAGLFDYQRDIAALAIRKRKFAVFARPGLGKTLIALEFGRHARSALGADRRVLMTAPLMVIRQTISEAKRFYDDRGFPLPIMQVRAKDLPDWVRSKGPEIGITNYEALTDHVPQGHIGALVCDESSIAKSAYGKTGRHMIRLGAGLDWKLALTGTPAPNDHTEFANHAVFLDAFPTVNSFLARFFINRGQTDNRWELKPHALRPFYRALSHWSIFLNSPATYNWSDNAGTIPPIEIHIHDVDLTAEQRSLVGQKLGTLFAADIGGITNRSTLSQIAKGNLKGKRIDTNKPAFIRALVDSWISEESTILWTRFNEEQAELERWFPEAASIKGDTPYESREDMIGDFQAGRRKVIISKPSCLGLGLNLQIATRQVFSSCEDSYEDFVQAVMRSNRVGSTRVLNVHIPITDVERPMLDNVLRKARRVEEDMRVQEELFKEMSRVA